MFIITIIIGISVLALGDMGKGRKAGYFAEQLQSTLIYAEGYAVVQPTTVIFELSHNRYQFKKLRMIAHDDGSLSYQWQTLNNPGNRNNSIPDYLTLQLENSNNNAIQINSNGILTPFSLRISVSGEDSYYLLTGNAAGVLTLTKQTSNNS